MHAFTDMTAQLWEFIIAHLIHKRAKLVYITRFCENSANGPFSVIYLQVGLKCDVI